MKVQDIPVAQIIVGERRRQDYGDIGALAQGLKRIGLLEPIIVDRNGAKDRFRLIAGERRLKAAQMLKWETISASLLEHLTEAELRDVELEENENRKPLTERERARTFASSKRLVESAKKAGEVIAATTKTSPSSKGGRPPKGDAPRQQIGEALGVSEGTVRNAEQHVATAETYPWMQGNNWRQSDVLAVRERLDEMKPEVRDDTVTILSAAKLLDPSLTRNLLQNIRAMAPGERKTVVKLSQSGDTRERSLALTKAAQLPPMPDPRLNSLEAALDSLRRATKPFPNDPLTPQIERVISDLRKIYAAVKEVSYDARRKEGGTIQ